MNFRGKIIFSGAVFSLIFFDQLAKYLIRLRGGFYLCNSGIAWSLPVSGIVFLFLWAALLGGMTVWFWRENKKGDLGDFEFFSWALVFSGAFSNFYDRMVLGCVVDFIDLRFWPVFNLADVFISFGIFFLALKIIKGK
jgi:signal peptidase II